MNENKEHGPIIDASDVHAIKLRAQGLEGIQSIVNEVSAEDLGEWLAVAKRGVVGGVFGDDEVPEVVGHLVDAIMSIGGQVEGKAAFINYLSAVDEGVFRMNTALQKVKEEREDLIKEIKEKRKHEDNYSGVPSSGSS